MLFVEHTYVQICVSTVIVSYCSICGRFSRAQACGALEARGIINIDIKTIASIIIIIIVIIIINSSSSSSSSPFLKTGPGNVYFTVSRCRGFSASRPLPHLLSFLSHISFILCAGPSAGTEVARLRKWRVWCLLGYAQRPLLRRPRPGLPRGNHRDF